MRLEERFEVVLCVDSLHHLLRFGQWEAAFAVGREHLSDGGLFVLQLDSDPRVEGLVESSPGATGRRPATCS